MDVAIFSLVVLALAAYVATPLYRGGPISNVSGPEISDGVERPSAGAGSEVVAGALRDLELDRATGLLDEAFETPTD